MNLCEKGHEYYFDFEKSFYLQLWIGNNNQIWTRDKPFREDTIGHLSLIPGDVVIACSNDSEKSLYLSYR